VVLGGVVPLVGPQEELRGLSGYSPRGLTSSTRWGRSKDFWGSYYKQTNQTNLNVTLDGDATSMPWVEQAEDFHRETKGLFGRGGFITWS